MTRRLTALGAVLTVLASGLLLYLSDGLLGVLLFALWNIVGVTILIAAAILLEVWLSGRGLYE